MSASYPRYVLAVLVASYVMNSLDRSIIAVLLEPIGREFGASDTQLGLLTGLAFAAVYSTLGIPVAALADRTSHRKVLAASIFVWSVATIFCGMAGSFLWLLVARVLNAAGEAGATPASHSIISDHFTLKNRATAISVFSLGAPLGLVFAGLWGGYGEGLIGWRATILVAGLPGLLLAPLVWLTINDAPKANTATAEVPITEHFGTRVAHLFSRRSFRHLFMAAAVHSVVVHGTTTFHALFMSRSYGWGTSSAGWMISLLGVTSAVGAILGGAAADRLSQRSGDVRWLLWVSALATLVAVPFQTVAYMTSSASLVVTVLPLATTFGMIFFGPTFAVGQMLSKPGSRAITSSVLLLGTSLVGLGLGPLLVGWISDLLSPIAQQDSLRYALLCVPLLNVWSAVHFFFAARALREDMA